MYRLNITVKNMYDNPMPAYNIHRGHIFIDNKKVPVVVTMMSEDTVYTYFRASYGPAISTFYCEGDIRGLRFSSSDWGKALKPAEAQQAAA